MMAVEGPKISAGPSLRNQKHRIAQEDFKMRVTRQPVHFISIPKMLRSALRFSFRGSIHSSTASSKEHFSTKNQNKNRKKTTKNRTKTRPNQPKKQPKTEPKPDQNQPPPKKPTRKKNRSCKEVGRKIVCPSVRSSNAIHVHLSPLDKRIHSKEVN